MLCEQEYKNLVLVCGMPIRWNTTYAEIDHVLELEPVGSSFLSRLQLC